VPPAGIARRPVGDNGGAQRSRGGAGDRPAQAEAHPDSAAGQPTAAGHASAAGQSTAVGHVDSAAGQPVAGPHGANAANYADSAAGLPTTLPPPHRGGRGAPPVRVATIAR
jgi:hypothetical protein